MQILIRSGIRAIPVNTEHFHRIKKSYFENNQLKLNQTPVIFVGATSPLNFSFNFSRK